MFHNDNPFFMLMQLFILTFLHKQHQQPAAVNIEPFGVVKMKVEIDLDWIDSNYFRLRGK